MVARKNFKGFPARKISEALLEFSWPLIEFAGPEVTKRDIEQILKIAVTVWNAAVFDAANGNDHYVTSMRDLTATNPLLAALVEQMLSRKRSEFADDQRIIVKYTVLRKNGEWRLQVQATDPSPRRQ